MYRLVKSETTKSIRHIQIRENLIQENVQSKLIIQGSIIPAGLFTKEDKDSQHFLDIRNLIMHSLEGTHHFPSSVTSTVAEGGVVPATQYVVTS